MKFRWGAPIFKPFSIECSRLERFFLLCILSLVSISFAQLPVRIPPDARRSLNSVCHTVNVKLLFLCRDSMWYVDFSDASPQIRKMDKITAAYIPTISPDGNWITYQTDNLAEGPSGSATPGKIWVRELAVSGTPVKVADTGYVPRFIQNTPADKPEVIYSTSLVCPENLCYNAGKTMKKQILKNVPQAAQTVYGAGSYYGGLSWDNRYLCTGWPGGTNAFLLDLQNDATGPRPVHSMRVKKVNTDIDTFVAVVACNVSRSASVLFPDNLLYVDLSSKAINDAGCYHPLLGDWGMHANLFVSRYDGEDLKVIGMPADYPLTPVDIAQGNGEPVAKTWELPEWSNHPYYATSSLAIERLFEVDGSWEHTINCEAIYLIDLKDSTYIKLLELTDTSFSCTTNLIYPFLWVEKTSDFQEDPTWLATTIWQRAGQGVINRQKGRPGNPCGQNFATGGATASVYSMLGRKIGVVKSPNLGHIGVSNAIRSQSSGVYLVQTGSRDGAGPIRRVVVER